MSQSGQETHKIHKIDDRTAFELMTELKEYLGITDPIHVRVVHGIGSSDASTLEEQLEIGKYRISNFNVGGRVQSFAGNLNFNARFDRFNSNSPENLDKYFDFITLTFSSQTSEWLNSVDVMLRCVDIVTSRDIEVTPQSTDSSELLRSLMVSQGAAHQRMLNELNKAITEIANRRDDLEADFARREFERAQQNTEIQSQLDQEKLALERQSYMATRRKLGQGIHKIMAGQGDGKDQNRKQRTVFAVLVFLAYFSLGVGGTAGTYLTFLSIAGIGNSGSALAGESFIWFLIVKFILSSIVTVFGFVSAANWMRRHLDNETNLAEAKLAFIADVERASWVIEAIHEVKNEAQGELPKEWVDAVTRNLFASKTSAADLDDGAQALRALIGLAGSAKVGPQGLEMEFNKKGTKALGQE